MNITSNHKYIITVFVLIVSILIIVLVNNIYSNSSASQVTNINATSTSSTSTSNETLRYMDIESYVKNNISELSPIREQLGGTFYVTAIEIKDDTLGTVAQGTGAREGSGTVSYEDGHNAYTADFKYMISEEGKPTVKYFRVRTD